ncbi:sugar ABC transporter ATP-binding protein, partial [Erysipelatoclostridium ramosum]|nr:sugar ABC transporter ATP-binding protein [Thomasclavelia ramosa]
AMTMADRIVVMKAGYIQQIGTPKEIYNNPKNMFVAGFLGAPATNFLQGTYQGNAFICNDQRIEMPDMF